jgi:hypothetical protein
MNALSLCSVGRAGWCWAHDSRGLGQTKGLHGSFHCSTQRIFPRWLANTKVLIFSYDRCCAISNSTQSRPLQLEGRHIYRQKASTSVCVSAVAGSPLTTCSGVALTVVMQSWWKITAEFWTNSFYSLSFEVRWAESTCDWYSMSGTKCVVWSVPYVHHCVDLNSKDQCVFLLCWQYNQVSYQVSSPLHHNEL